MTSALKIPAFRRLALAYAVNGLGDWAGEIALATAIFHLTHSPTAVAAVWLVQRCLGGLVTPVLVARLERVPTRRLLPTLYAVQALVYLGLAGMAATGSLTLAHALPLVAIDGLAGPAARAIARTATVAITRPAGLHREGNATLNLLFTANAAAGPAIGGLVVVALAPAAALAVDAASFVLAAAVLAGAALPGEPEAEGCTLERFRSGLSYVRDRPLLGRLLGGQAVAMAFFSAIVPIEVVFITDTLGGSESGYGTVLTAWGVGMVVGGALGARLSNVPLRTLLLVSVTVEILAHFGMGLSSSVAAVAAWSALGGIGNGADAMAFVTAVQQRTADAFQARVNGLYEAAMTAMPGFGFVLGGLVAAAYSARAVYIIAGLGALGVLLWAVARLRHVDWDAPDAVVERRSRVAAPGSLVAAGQSSL